MYTLNGRAGRRHGWGRGGLPRNCEPANRKSRVNQVSQPGLLASHWRSGTVRIGLIKLLTVAVTILLAAAVEFKSPGDARGYTLASGDRVTVTVFGQTELSGDFLIDRGG